MQAVGPLLWIAVCVASGCGGSSSQPDGRTGGDGPGGDAASVDAAVDAMVSPGTLIRDPSFGDGGVASAGLGRSADVVTSGAVQADGKLVLAGGSQRYEDQLAQFAGEMVVARLTTAGAPDATFGTGGVALVPVGARATANAVAVQGDGRIVVAGEVWYSLGTTALVVARLMPDGALDTAFGTSGVTIVAPSGYPSSVAIAGDGKILVGGQINQAGVGRLLVARLTTGGALDDSFGAGGISATTIGERGQAHGLAFGAGDTIVAAGLTGTASLDIAIVRLLSTGAPDPAFGGGDGIVTTAVGAFNDEARAVAVDAANRIVIAGYAGQGSLTDDGAVLARFDATGAPDATFGGGDGIVIDDTLNLIDRYTGLAVLADGTIVVGEPPRNRVHRYLTGGTHDPAFGAGGIATIGLAAFDNMAGVAFAASGELHPFAIHGNTTDDEYTLIATKLSAAGAQDGAYGTAGRAEIATGASVEVATSVVANPDGSVVAAGFGVGAGFRRADVARFLDDGSLDPAFGAQGVLRVADLATARAMVHGPGGDVIVVGDAVTTGLRYAAVRLTSTGVPDAGFGTSGLFSDSVLTGGNGSPRAAATDGSGIVIVGNASTGFLDYDAGAVRITVDGDLDPAFGGDGRVTLDLGSDYDELTAVDIAADGTVVAAGYGNATAVVRFTADGALDPTFDTDGVAAPGVLGLIVDRVRVLGDGRILLAGYRYGLSFDVVVVRLTAAGALDPTFGTGGVVAHPVTANGVTLLPFGNRFRGPDMVVAGAQILVAATVAHDNDESILLLTLDAGDGHEVAAVTAGTAGWWTGFAIATTANGGAVIAGRGYSPVTGTDLGVARFIPAP